MEPGKEYIRARASVLASIQIADRKNTPSLLLALNHDKLLQGKYILSPLGGRRCVQPEQWESVLELLDAQPDQSDSTGNTRDINFRIPTRKVDKFIDYLRGQWSGAGCFELPEEALFREISEELIDESPTRIIGLTRETLSTDLAFHSPQYTSYNPDGSTLFARTVIRCTPSTNLSATIIKAAYNPHCGLYLVPITFLSSISRSTIENARYLINYKGNQINAGLNYNCIHVTSLATNSFLQ